MLLLFVVYYVDIHFFTHTHIINGVTIVHSHIHDRHHHDTDAGGHTISEITLISTLAHQFLTTGELYHAELEAAAIIFYTLTFAQDVLVDSVHLFCPSLRAPPAVA